MEKIVGHIDCWIGRFRDAFSACSIMMVGGDVTALTIGHTIKAAQTGFIAAVAATIVIIFAPHFRQNKYVLAGLTGLCTAIADLATHPSHFGGWSTEAIVTGIGAALLTLSFAQVKRKHK